MSLPGTKNGVKPALIKIGNTPSKFLPIIIILSLKYEDVIVKL